jgi:hypothetical protein
MNEKYGRNRIKKPEQVKDTTQTNYHPFFPPFAIYPIAVNDTLREIKKTHKLPPHPDELELLLEEEPETISFHELTELVAANEIDTMTHEQKFEQWYPDWVLKKRIVEKARDYYADQKNEDKILTISVLPDKSLKIGYDPDNECYSFDYNRLILDITDVERFATQISFLREIQKIIKQMYTGKPIDGQYDRPGVLRFIIDQRDFWGDFQDTENIPENTLQELKCNELIFSHFYEKVLDYPIKEDQQNE